MIMWSVYKVLSPNQIVLCQSGAATAFYLSDDLRQNIICYCVKTCGLLIEYTITGHYHTGELASVLSALFV